jgi:hypothetical protein
MKIYTITFKDGAVHHIKADRSETIGGRTVFYAENSVVKIVHLAEVAILNEMEANREGYRNRAQYPHT